MHEQEHLHPPQEPDVVSWKAIVAVAAATIAVSVALSLVARWIAVSALPPAGSVPEPVPPSGELEFELFQDDAPADGERDRDARLQRLRSWGWLDRRQGTVHMPIDRAMELVVQQDEEKDRR